jgi:uncharacterized protein DUF998
MAVAERSGKADDQDTMPDRLGMLGTQLSRAVLIAVLIAAILFIATDLLGLARWKGYDYIHQSISDLTAIGSPTRSWAVPLTLGHNLALLIAGVAILLLPGRNLPLRITASLLIVTAIAWLGAQLFPNQVGESPAPSSPLVVLGATAVVASVLMIAFGAAAFSGWFRIVSIGVLAAFAVLTILGFMQGAPRVGLQERVLSYVTLGWMVLLGVAALIDRGGQPAVSF